MNTGEINVLYESNDEYAPLTGVSILSLLEHHKTGEHIRFKIVDDDISEENKKRIRITVETYGQDVEFIEAAPYLEVLENLGVKLYFSSLMTYMSMLIKRIYEPYTGKVYFLDGDTYFAGDISEWCKVDLNGKACAMALDCINHKYLDIIGLDRERAYYNTGFIIFDLNVWSKRNCEERLTDHLRNKKSEYLFAEQDLENIVIYDDIYRMNIKYNLISSWLLYGYKFYSKIYGISQNLLTQNEYEDGIDNALLYHFAGNTFGRPWRGKSCHPIADEYLKCWRRSQWDINDMSLKKISIPYRLLNFSYKHMPSEIHGFIGYIIQQVYMRIEYGK